MYSLKRNETSGYLRATRSHLVANLLQVAFPDKVFTGVDSWYLRASKCLSNQKCIRRTRTISTPKKIMNSILWKDQSTLKTLFTITMASFRILKMYSLLREMLRILNACERERFFCAIGFERYFLIWICVACFWFFTLCDFCSASFFVIFLEKYPWGN